MKKNFSACVYTATAKAAKVINIEVNEFLNAEGAPVHGVYFAALNPGEITVFIEFNGVLFLFRTYQEETFYFREKELSAFLGAIASDVPGSIRARRLWPSFCVLLAIQKAGTPEQYQEAAEIRAAIIREREAEDAERERAEREAEERERQKEAAELEREITEGRARLLAGEEITGYQLEKLLQRYGVKVHPRTLHNIQRVRVIKPGELRYNRGTEARKMNADGVFKAFNQLADIIQAEAANVAPVAVPEVQEAAPVAAPAVDVDQVPAPVAAVLPSFDVPGSLEASNNNAYADSEKSQNSAKGIQDFGQKIGGAHKDRIREAVAQLQGVDASALLLKPLSKVVKLPNLRALFEAGSIDESTARRAWYLWNCIGTKPGASWPSRLQRWAERAAALIAQLADTLAYGVSEKSQNFELPEGVKPAQSWDLFLQEMTAANWPADEYKRGAYFVGHYWMNPARFSIHTEKGSYSTAFDSVAECVKAIRAKVEKNTTKEPQKFSMYQTSAGKYFISPKGKSGIKLLEFDNSADAWAAYGDTEKLGKIYEELKKFPSERRDWNRPRLGEDWRGGQDMTPEAFGEVFPFRGVEFGNWVNQLERAACLNECADALNDLAGVIGIRPEAVALGGSLAWAFGSRGVGKALAHYEPARRVVNLTKKKGNGCVAHEWFHALDNYIMIKAGKPSLMAVSDTHAYGDAEKSPIFEAAKALKNALLKSDMYSRSRRIDAFRSAPYWATVTEMAARGFEAVVFYALQDAGLCNDYLVSIKEATDYTRSECYPYPTREEAAELAPLYRAFIEAAFTEAEREVIKPSAELPAPPALVTYDPAQPIESAPFQVQDEAPAVAASEPMDANNDPTPADGGTGAAYGSSEKSPNFDDLEECSNLLVHHQRMKGEHPDAVLLYRMGNFYEAYFQDSQTVADCLGITRRLVHGYSVAGFPFHALDVYLPKLIRAGHRVAICDDPRPFTRTNPEGRKESAYWNPEKSQLPEKLNRKEQDGIAEGFGLVPESHGYDGTLYMLKDAAGYPVKNAKGETLQIHIDAHIELTEGPNSNPALWQRKGYTRDRLTNWWSIRTYCTREDGLCVEDYNPTVLDNGKRFVINFDWMLSITAENLKRIIAEVLNRFYGDSQKSQNSVKPRQKSVSDIYTQYCRLRDEIVNQCYPLNGIHLVRMNKILEIYERYVNNVHKFMKCEEWDDKKPFIRELYMLYRRPDVATLNKSMRICELDEKEFIDENGKAHTYGRGSYGFFIPKKGWVSMPGDGALPYCNDRETLKKIADDGGYLNFDGFRFVWPIMKGRDRDAKPVYPSKIDRKEWLGFKVQGGNVPLGCRQYIYEFIEKSLISAPDGVEWRIRHDSLWGIELKVNGVFFTVAYTFGRNRFYFDVVDVSGRFPSAICSPISWCRYLDAALSDLRIPMSWPRPSQFYAIEGYLPLDGEPMFVG